MTAPAPRTSNRNVPLDLERGKVLAFRRYQPPGLLAELQAETRAILHEAGSIRRPVTRGDCAGVPRPCPFVACRWHLYCDITRAGSLHVFRPGFEPSELPAGCSCVLDVADRGGATLEEIGAMMNLTREMIRQIEAKAFSKIKRKPGRLRDWLEDRPVHGVRWFGGE